MWPWFHSVGALGIAQGAVAVAASSADAVQLHNFAGSDYGAGAVRARPGDEAAHLRETLARIAARRGQPVDFSRVVVGNDLARHWLFEPPAGAASLREIQAVSQARFSELYGESADDWIIAGDWRTGRPFLCAALPKFVVLALREAAAKATRGSPITSVLVCALELFHRRLPNSGWCCVRSARSVTFVFLRGGMPVTCRVVPISPDAAFTDVLASGAQELQREAARHALAPVGQATWLDLVPHDARSALPSHLEHAGIVHRFVRVIPRGSHDKAQVPQSGEAMVAALLGTMSRGSHA